MGDRNHSLPFFVYHSLTVEHSLSLLLDFSWPQTTSPALLNHWVWTISWSTAVLKNHILQSPLSLISQKNLWITGSTISSDLGKYTGIKDGTNFMSPPESYLGVWTTKWPDFTFRRMTFLIVSSTPSTGSLPWCLSL